jgi:hypothetical protein
MEAKYLFEHEKVRKWLESKGFCENQLNNILLLTNTATDAWQKKLTLS